MEDKKVKLINYLAQLKSVALAFSGGVDSTFLLRACKEALGNKAVAITIVSPYIPKWEIEEAKAITTELNMKHYFIEVPILEEIRYNPKDKCYICKKFLFSKLKEKAEALGIDNLIDGTNFDDTKDYRPGMRALKELEVKSPLLENKLTKEDIRVYSKEYGLATWNKPAYACLLTRIECDTEVTEKKLSMIEEAETYLMDLGFQGVRVRTHGDLARIEVQPEQRSRFYKDEILDNISKNLKAMGYKYVTFDMEGYKMGSLNREV